MKRLIIPIMAALIAGIGGGSGYAYMNSAPIAADSVVADSAHVAAKGAEHEREASSPDSTATDSASDSASADSAAKAHEPQHPLTPADSIRAVQAARAAIKTESAAGRDANRDAKAAAPKSANVVEDTAALSHEATRHAATPPVAQAAPIPAAVPGLPEQRLAKIFGAMQAKDAGKVLEQMSDADVRTVLGMMSDRQAAAILATFPASRAAAVTKSSSRAPGSTP